MIQPMRSVRADGYASLKLPDHPRARSNGYVYEHIVVAEKKLGRSLLPKERVHHENHNPSDNHPDNLIVCKSQADHMIQHARQRVIAASGDPDTQRICHRCKQLKLNTEFSPSSSRGKKCLSSACKECLAISQRNRRRQRVTPYIRPSRRKEKTNGSGSTNTDRG